MAVDYSLDEARAFVLEMRDLGATMVSVGSVHVAFDAPLHGLTSAAEPEVEREPDPEAEARAALRLAYLHTEGE